MAVLCRVWKEEKAVLLFRYLRTFTSYNLMERLCNSVEEVKTHPEYRNETWVKNILKDIKL